LVKLRLTLTGRKNRRTYRLVAEHSTDRRDGRGAEFLGNYDPSRKENKLVINEEAVYKWLKDGAVPSETVDGMLKKQGFWKKWEMIKAGQDVSGVVATPKAVKVKRKKKREKVTAA